MSKKNIVNLILAIVCLLILVVTSILVVNGITLPFDNKVHDYFISIRGEKYNFVYWFFRILTELGNTYAVIVICLIVLILTRVDNKSLSFVIGLILLVAISYILKDAFARIRPDLELRWMSEKSYSYPSGHSNTAGFVYSFLLYIVFNVTKNKKIRIATSILFVSIILIVMTSRLVLAVHYFTDLVGGLSLGLLFSFLTMIVSNILITKNILKKGIFSKKEEE